MGLMEIFAGPKGLVLKFVRAGGRCPADDFLRRHSAGVSIKFKASFKALTEVGAKYINDQRFKPLKGKGRPLWEFKHHDQRIFCVREVSGDHATVILLNGWEKDKEGRTREEDREIQRAKALEVEYLAAHKGGS